MADQRLAQDAVVRQTLAALEAVLERAESPEDLEALTMRVLATLEGRAFDEPADNGLDELDTLFDLADPKAQEVLAYMLRQRLPGICRRAERLASERGAARAKQIRDRVVRVLTPPSPVRPHVRTRARARRRAPRRVGRRTVASSSSRGPEPPGEPPGPVASPEIALVAAQAGER